MHLIVGKCPIEDSRSGPDQGQAQPFGIGCLTERFEAIFQCRLNDITPYHTTRIPRDLCRVLEIQANGGRLKNSKFRRL
jgi:hypothetical protein